MTNLDKKLKEIEERAEKATKGNWTIERPATSRRDGPTDSYLIYAEVQYVGEAFNNRNDAEFIAASRTDIPRLARSLEYLRTQFSAGEYRAAWEEAERILDGKGKVKA